MAEACNWNQAVEWRVELNETWLKSMETRLQSDCLPNHRKRNGAQQPATIFKVLSNIRQANTEAFEPQIISFGPYHHGKHQFKAMEEHKWRYLNKFLSRNPNKRLRDYVAKIKSVVDQARSCYWDEVLMEDDPFVEMLVLDGSMIVELLMMRQEPPPEDRDFDPIVDTMFTFPLIVYDMLKLENQVPFFVLECLYDVVMDVGNLRLLGEQESGSFSTDDQTPCLSLLELVFSFVSQNLFEDHIILREPSPEEQIHHMLHFLHSCIVQDQPMRRKNRKRFWYRYRRRTRRGLISLKYMFFNAVTGKSTTSRRVLLDREEESSNTAGNAADSIPAAQELKEAGIKFKRKKRGGFLEVTFSGGYMEMTPLVIYEQTSTVLHNLIAFEQCYPDAGAHVTGYSVFLDCLIDTPADVGLLRQKGVVENKLGSDKEAAYLVNRLRQHVAVGDHQLSGLFTEVQHYCRSSWPRWRARLAREYFGNPWAIISLVAAVVLLFLTGVQTAFAIIPYIWPSEN